MPYGSFSGSTRNCPSVNDTPVDGCNQDDIRKLRSRIYIYNIEGATARRAGFLE